MNTNSSFRLALRAQLLIVIAAGCSSGQPPNDPDRIPHGGDGQVTRSCGPWPDWDYIQNDSQYRSTYGEFSPPAQGDQGFAQPPSSPENPAPQAGTVPPCPAEPTPNMRITGSHPGRSISLSRTSNPNECCYDITEQRYYLGRPLIQDGKTLIAKARYQPAAEPLPGLSPELSEILSELWIGDALMEHASIASFAKLSLELMAMGAPAELLEEAHRSASDEIRHATACFALANRYAPRCQPSWADALALGSSLKLALDFSELAVHTVVEGCMGETYAALMAAEQCAAAEDSHLKSVLSMIAEDEGRHSAFAWKIVRWAISAGGETVRDAVRRAFEQAFLDWEREIGEEPAAPEPDLSVYGRLSARERIALKKTALTDILRPCAQALLHT